MPHCNQRGAIIPAKSLCGKQAVALFSVKCSGFGGNEYELINKQFLSRFQQRCNFPSTNDLIKAPSGHHDVINSHLYDDNDDDLMLLSLFLFFCRVCFVPEALFCHHVYGRLEH